MKKIKIALTVAGGLAVTQLSAHAAEPEVTAPQVVEAIEGAFGVTHGERRNHIKGSCAAGEFVGTAEAPNTRARRCFPASRCR